EKDKGSNPKDKGSIPATPIEPGKPTNAATFEPGYEDGSGKPGTDVTVPAPTFKDKDGKDTTAPEGTKFTPGDNAPEGVTINETTGEITVPVPADAKPGDKITVPVVVTYPDGTKDNVDVTVTVEQPDVPEEPAKDNEKYEPEYNNGTGQPGEDVTIDVPTFKDGDNNKIDVPSGTNFTPGAGTPDGVTVNPDGSIKVTIPETANPGDKITVPVVVTYPDGTQDNVEVTVTVTEKDATPVTPVAPTEHNPSLGASAGDPASCELPPFVTVEKTEGVEYKVTVDGKELTPDADGKYFYEYGQTVKVEATPAKGYTFPEGAQTTWTYTTQQNEVCEAPAEKPDWKDDSGKPGDKVEIPNTGGDVPAGTTVETDGPGKAEIDENGNLIVDIDKDAKPGDKIEVIVKDKDGKEIDRVDVEVEQPDTPAEKPDWKDDSGKPGDKVEIPNTGGDVPAGTTVETEGPGKAEIDENGNLIVDIDKDAKPGDKIEVIVKDKDGKEIDRVDVEVEQPDTPAEKPDWKDDSGKPGDKVEIPNTGGDVPAGTTVETEGPGKAEIDENGKLIVDIDKDAKPGDKITVIVKDKDGKVIDEVTVTVTEKDDQPGGPVGSVKDPNKIGAIIGGTIVGSGLIGALLGNHGDGAGSSAPGKPGEAKPGKPGAEKPGKPGKGADKGAKPGKAGDQGAGKGADNGAAGNQSAGKGSTGATSQSTEAGSRGGSLAVTGVSGLAITLGASVIALALGGALMALRRRQS
ncbi:YPDG domain-containing protein, partial [Corynebacterium macclintockiae]|uniref:YPDG domain-containing protein n=1 Tax=Corynebacterium macclintockiae TaxID=2913501 RepID=UPI003EB7FB2E